MSGLFERDRVFPGYLARARKTRQAGVQPVWQIFRDACTGLSDPIPILLPDPVKFSANRLVGGSAGRVGW
jgi:hypothetical protein